MKVYFTSLNSGSNGNCYYVGNENEAVLIDAGISCKETERRMQNLGLSMKAVKAIFISHEHSDHIKGVEMLSQKYNLPVHITPKTRAHCARIISQKCGISLEPFLPVQYGNLTVTAFPKKHDACDPHSFIISSHGIRIGVFTDIGAPCEHLLHHFKQCHAAFLESNYDETMLENSAYPYYLKNRIRGGQGHLSNKQALEIFTSHRPAFMSHLLLAHLSQENNDPRMVQEMFTAASTHTQIVVASRYRETKLFTLRARVKGLIQNKTAPIDRMQLSLFE